MVFIYNPSRGRWEWRDRWGVVLFVMECPTPDDIVFYQDQAARIRAAV